MVRPSSIVLPGALLLVGLLHLDAYDAPERRAVAQEAQQTGIRNVISKRIGVSSDEAALSLEMEDGSALEVAFSGGNVTLDGDRIGGYAPGGALEGAWRSLLGQVLALDNGPLAQALVDWSPPSGLTGADRTVGSRLDEALQSALTVPAAPAPNVPAPSVAAPNAPGTVTVEAGGSVTDLLRRADLLALLGEASDGLDFDAGVRLVVGQDVLVEAGESVQGILMVVDGDATIEGAVLGDVVVTEGRLRLLEGGSITGDVRLADAEISMEGGTHTGSLIEVSEARTEALRNLSRLQRVDGIEDLERLEGLVDVDELLADIRADIRRDLRREGRRDRGFSVFGGFARGIGGLIQNVFGFLILLVLAGGAIRFFPDNVRRVERAVDASPVRSGIVGVAGVFLLIPVWILGMVALAISLVGIPALIAWIPLFPLAAAFAFLLGYLVSAILLGRWIIDQDFQNLDFLRRGNTLHAAAAGIAALLLPYVAANMLHFAGGWLDGFGNLLDIAGGMAGIFAAILGFGAVLLTRGGRRPLVPEPWAPTPEWTDEPWDDEWSDLEAQRTGYPEPDSQGGSGRSGPAPSEGDNVEEKESAEDQDEDGERDEDGEKDEDGAKDEGEEGKDA